MIPSPYINRFLSPDTIVPGAANPQAWNRYSYVLGNPLKYTDPSGHMQESDDYAESDGKCSKGDTSCNWVGKTPTKPRPKPQKSKGNNGNGECSTVSCNALNGDILAIADLLIPTHFGWRDQFELSGGLGSPVSFGPSGTLGINFAYNRVSGELAAFADWTLEGSGSTGLPVGASFTTGPIVGWGSSTINDVAQGNSAIISGTAAYEGAISASVSVPVDGITPHVDPVYGQIPTTVYGGGGAGYAYAGLAAGGTHVFASAIVDLFP
jgi:hypothetical protein